MASADAAALQARLAVYLQAELAATSGSLFIKSKYIARDLEGSVKRVGGAMAALEADASTPVQIQRWGGDSDGTTWHISERSATDS